MHRISYTVILFLVIILTSIGFTQTVNYNIQQGSIDTGAVVNISSFADLTIIEEPPYESGLMNTEYFAEPIILEQDGQTVYESMYFEDTFHTDHLDQIGDNPLLITKFNQSLANNVAPPDPTLAVGPNHVMVLTNNGTGIYIYDKQGNLLKSLNSTQWWSAVWPSQSGDPQILYDHFSNRWVMVFMQVDDGAQTAGNLIAFSDDDDPIGTWYMYRLDTKMHGTTNSSTWGDYPQIGYDDKAIYIMTRLFGFSSGFFGSKIRIISKSALYNGNAGPLTYTDIWNITLPGGATTPDVIHPTFNYTAANEHYFLHAPREGGNFYSLYKLSDPIGNPVLTGTNIIVPFFGQTPNAQQLGTTTAIESNGSHIKTSPVFKDGFLYATHSIRNSQHSAYGSVKYVKINTATNAITESYELGAQGYSYFYPAIAVDADDNVIITCSRSGDSEYPGAYFLGRRATDPPGLSNSYVLQEGLASYVCSFCGTRNRWGDYLAAYIDHTNEYDFWMVSQYAAATNTYAVSIGHVRLKPYSGAYGFSYTSSIDFENIEVGFESPVFNAYLNNFGDADIIVSELPDSVGSFYRISSHSFPITISQYDSLLIQFQFKPKQRGQLDQFYPITSNSSNFTGFNLKGFGYEIFAASPNKFYAVSGVNNNGALLTIDPSNGTGTNIGESTITDINGIAINPKTNLIYGIRSSNDNSQLVRINAFHGDSYSYLEIQIPNLITIAFDSSGQLYGATLVGEIYSIDIEVGSFELISQMPVQRVSFTFNHLNNELWGTFKNFPGTPRDLTVKIDLETGDTTRIGQTGFGVNTIGLAFSDAGELYGVKGPLNSSNDFFGINQVTGIGTIVGSIGLPDMRGLAFSSEFVTSISEENIVLPDNFTLSQNYPNPFNPSTTINFSVPQSSDVKLTIYNLLGETVKVLVNRQMNAGNHSVVWNADDNFGKKISSGIYFYELKANSDNGNNFNQIRKMVFLK